MEPTMVIPVEVKRHDPSTHYATGGVLPSKVLPSVLRIVTRVYGFSDATTRMMADYYHLDEKV